MTNTTRTLRNVTPHDLHIMREDGVVEVIPQSGVIARAFATDERVVNELLGLPVTRREFNRVENLPECDLDENGYGTYYVVSWVVLGAAAHSGRTTRDLVAPDDFVRTGDGQILASRGWKTL